MTETSNLFPQDFLRELDLLRITFGQLSSSVSPGQQGGIRKGSGLEFVDRREYAPGDDFRHIDWAVWARHGDLLIRRFLEESSLVVHLILDRSMSMSIGQPSKWDAARRIVAALGYLALTGADQIQISAFSSTLSDPFRMSRSAQIDSLFAYLSSLELESAQGSLNRAVAEFLARKHRNGVIVLVSDLLFPEPLGPAMAQLRQTGHDVHLLQITAREEAVPEVGSFTLVDAETEAERSVVIDRRRQQAFREVFEQFLETTRQEAIRQGCQLTQITNEIPYAQAVIRLLGPDKTQSL